MHANRRAWRPLMMGRRAAVATNHPQATSTGISILRAGGNVADAAAAISLALGVVEPHMSGLGGDTFIHLRSKKLSRSRVYNGCGGSPISATPEMFREGMPISGPLASSTPGCLAAVFAMHNEHGTLSWESVCAPAIELAEEGFAVTQNLRRFIRLVKAKLDKNLSSTQTFLVDGAVPELGAIIRQPALAKTLRVIAACGADEFYRGALSQSIVRDLADIGALLRADDLATFVPETQQPIGIHYRGYEVLQTPPNSTGFALLQMLRLVEHFDLTSLGEGSDALLHLLIEAKKRAFLDMERYAGDPRFHEAPLEYLLSDSYTGEVAASISLDKATSIPLTGGADSEECTTCYCIIDNAGNAVSAIQSLNNPFGSGITLPRSGIVMNNRMAAWHLNPSHPNVFRAGKRVRQTMNAPMILRDGEIWAVFGTPGADSQLQVNLQTTVSLVDFHLDPQTIAEAPRWTSSQHGQGPVWPHGGDDVLTLEEGFSQSTVSGLLARGHKIRIIPALEGPCSMECIRVLDNGVRVAGSDPRWDGWAAAY